MGEPNLFLAQFQLNREADNACRELLGLRDIHTNSGTAFERPKLSPAMQSWAKEHGFEWPSGDGFVWGIEDGPLEVTSVGSLLVVFHRSAILIGDRALETFCRNSGATQVIRVGHRFDLEVRAVDEPSAGEVRLALAMVTEDEDDIEFEEVPRPGRWFARVELKSPGGSEHAAFAPGVSGEASVAEFLLVLGGLAGIGVRLVETKPTN